MLVVYIIIHNIHKPVFEHDYFNKILETNVLIVTIAYYITIKLTMLNVIIS